MSPQELDIVVRVAGTTLLLWAAALPGRIRSGAQTFFIPLAICLAGFLAGNTPDEALQLSGPAGRIAVILAGYAAVFLWWWCLAVFDPRFRPRGLVLAAGAIWVIVASADRGLFGEALAGRGLSWVLIALGLLMIAHLGWRLLRDRAEDLIDRRRRARGVVVAFLAIQLLADFAVDLVFGLDWGPRAFTILQNAALLIFVGGLLSLGSRRQAVPPPPQSLVGMDGPEKALTKRLETLMLTERIYLNPDLTFDDFVRAMGAPERTVRRLINQVLGHDHFRTFLNTYRVEEAKRRLSEPARREDKLIAIALDSGFASLPSFNRVFRDMQGCAPGAYRSAALTTAGSPSSEDSSAAF